MDLKKSSMWKDQQHTKHIMNTSPALGLRMSKTEFSANDSLMTLAGPRVKIFKVKSIIFVCMSAILGPQGPMVTEVS